MNASRGGLLEEREVICAASMGATSCLYPYGLQLPANPEHIQVYRAFHGSNSADHEPSMLHARSALRIRSAENLHFAAVGT